MISHEQATGTLAMDTAASTPFTAEEAQRLDAFQRRFGYQPHLLELGLDIQRLEFARWLVRHGILNEGLEQPD